MASTSLSLLMLAILYIVLACCDPGDDVSCANHVHRECGMCKLNHNEKWDDNWCKRLEKCGECLAIPRCPSRYLERYKDLAVTLMKMAKITKFCPHIDYSKLLNWADGAGKCQGAGDGKIVYDQCGQQCSCSGGHLYSCKRIRKEFTQMSYEERRRFVDVFYKATTDRFYAQSFHNLLMKHSRIPSDFLHHMPDIFLPWHRWFSLKIENFLRQIDCRVTLPYYQWTARVDDGTVWRTTDPSDVWYGGPQGIGGNGVKPSLCVQTGKFREGHWHISVIKGGGCLKRNFDFKCKLYSQKKVGKLLKGKFEDFERIVREELHSTFHDCIGGLMPDNRFASGAPEFILHHAFMDKLWDQFQKMQTKDSKIKSHKKGLKKLSLKEQLKRKYSYYGSVNYLMPFADIYGFEVFDNANLPGGVAVAYKEFKAPDKKLQQKDYFYFDEFMPEEEIDPEFEVDFQK